MPELKQEPAMRLKGKIIGILVASRNDRGGRI
jgi:hypothetical protein